MEHVEKLAESIAAFVSGSSKAAEQVEVCAILSDSHFLRMARNTILQTQADATARVSVRVVDGKRTGIAVTSSIDADALARAHNAAKAMAAVVPPRDEAGLPEEPHHRIESPELADFPSDLDKWKHVSAWFAIAEASGGWLSGSYETSIQTTIVANSRGTLCVQRSPRVAIQFIVERGERTGYGSYLGATFASDLVTSQLERAISKAAWGERPVRVEPGEYRAVLEPEALAEFLDVVSLFSFGGRHVLEGRSFVSDTLGSQLFPPELTIVDDARHPEQIPSFFDFEGAPKRRTVLVDRGVVRGAVFDTETARLAETRSTGHALPLPNPHGPVPAHLVVEPGPVDSDALIRAVGDGILVTRFHYVNIEDQKRAVLTGMTRDGAFLIENGEVVAPIVDVRFTQNAVEALASVIGVANDTRLVQPGFAQVVTPTVALGRFTVTGAKG